MILTLKHNRYTYEIVCNHGDLVDLLIKYGYQCNYPIKTLRIFFTFGANLKHSKFKFFFFFGIKISIFEFN